MRIEKKGASLLEFSLVPCLVLLIGAVCACSFRGSWQDAVGKRTLKDMSAALKVAVQYRDINGAWPGNISELHSFDGRILLKNAFGQDMEFASHEKRGTISSKIPAGMAVVVPEGELFVVEHRGEWDEWSMSAVGTVGRAGRLFYEKRLEMSGL
jgi:hypothetical protein